MGNHVRIFQQLNNPKLNCNYYFCICGEDYDEIELILIAFQFAKETFAQDMQGFFLKTSLRSASWLLVKGDTFFPFEIFSIK